MRLAILTQYYPPEIGAPQARLSALAREAVRRGHDVTVLTAMPSYPRGQVYDGYGGLLRREQVEGLRVVRSFIYPTQKASFVHRMANYLSFVGSSALSGTALLSRPDYLMVESPPLFLILSAYWLSRLKGARLIFNVSDLWPESAARLGVIAAGSPAYRLSERLESFAYHRSWLVTGQSRSILADINRRFPTLSTYHLSNGVDSRVFGPERASSQARSLLAGEGQRCIALYAGLHGLAQGLDQVLEAARRLGPESALGFVLVGDGPEKQALVRQAAEYRLGNVRFLDPLPGHEVPPILASADIILVTLKTYIPGAVPSKLYEAMASGRPVVLVAIGEAADIVREHEAGMVVEPGDSEGLAAALARLEARPDLRREMGDRGRRAAQQHFDRNDILARFLDHLEGALRA
jgi:glycosyltransferase involved in cell wall biosynthesis